MNYVVFYFKNEEIVEIPANEFEQYGQWVVAYQNGKIMAMVKEEYLKAVCLIEYPEQTIKEEIRTHKYASQNYVDTEKKICYN